jgi:hypothetical protein
LQLLYALQQFGRVGFERGERLRELYDAMVIVTLTPSGYPI